MGGLSFERTKIEGVYVVTPRVFRDERGEFSRVFCENDFREAGLEARMVNINTSTSTHAGTIRGMHYQLPPSAEDKLVRCLSGSVYDVAVDLRKGSPTFLQYHAEELNPSNAKMLLVPKGFAHGFLTLKDNSTVVYGVTAFYSSKDERALRWNDPRIGINWPLSGQPIVSEKDSKAPLIDEGFEGVVL